MNQKIFICYSAKDKPIADLMVDEIENQGISCWMAPRDFSPGVDWGSAIADAIQSSQVMLLIFSKSANETKRVMDEVGLAVNSGLDIIPFRVEDVKPTGSLKYFLSMTHWIDGFAQPKGESMEKLVETLKVYLGIEAKSIKKESQKEQAEIKRVQEGKRGGFLGRLFGKNEPTRLKLVDSFIVQSGSSQGEIQLCLGDVAYVSSEHAVDVLVTSAYRDSYYPVPGSVFGSLNKKGISVEALANQKEVDLRGAFSCWLSKEILNPPEGIQFKRILCYEPENQLKPGNRLGTSSAV